MEALPDLETFPIPELRDLIDQLVEEENQVSYRRRILHGKIDILKAELLSRLQRQVGEGRGPLYEVDVEQARRDPRLEGGRLRTRTSSTEVTHVHCPECGFQNLEAANYCSKCGALLIKDEPGGSTTMTYAPEDVVDEEGEPLSELRIEGTALVVRSGGGRAGETFPLDGARVEIGRSPDAPVFLDDVTVSRSHAMLVRDDIGYTIEDAGSLNGTYVNRRRVERAKLEDGDEVQIGKYRLTFLEH